MKDIPLRVRISPIHEQAIGVAEKLWPGENRSELVRRILEDWHHQREGNGGKTERIIKAIKETEFTILEAISHVQPPLH